MTWRILVIISFASSLTLLFLVLFRDSPLLPPVPVVTNEVHTVHEVLVISNVPVPVVSAAIPKEETKPEKPSIGYSVVRGDYQFHQCNALKWVDFEGDEYRVGYPSEYGRVVVVDRYFTMCMDDNGKCTYLRPGLSIEDKTRRRYASPLAGSIQGDRGDASAAR